MQTNPAVEQNKNVIWWSFNVFIRLNGSFNDQSPWNQSGRWEKICVGKDVPKNQVLSLKWKTERVREDESGDSEDEEDDKLLFVIDGSEGDCIW